jgi:hypothetical protein
MHTAELLQDDARSAVLLIGATGLLVFLVALVLIFAIDVGAYIAAIWRP